MNLAKFLAACAVGAAGLTAGVANALPPGEYDGTVLNVFFGGATATDNILENNFLLKTGGVCAPGTISIYRVQVSNRNNRVVFCRVTSGQVTGFPAAPGRKVAFHKESIGGSSNGVVPLINQTTLEFFNMASAASCTGPAPVNETTTLNAYNNYTACPDVTVAQVPNGGISDTEPRLSFPAPSSSEIARLNTVAGLDIIFGVPASENLYRALQAAQGFIDNDVAKNPTAKCVGGIDAPGCVPSLTRAQIRGMYTSATPNWDNLFVGNGTATAEDGTPLPGLANVTPPSNAFTGTSPDNRVFICRRVATSGTQASAESYFLKQRCQAGVRTFAGGNPETGTTPAAQGYNSRVTPGEGSGDVRTCLQQHNANGTWAIGVLSTEVSSSQATGFRMLAIDGAAPNIANVMNGRYDYFVSNTLNRRAAAQPGAPTGETLALLQKIEGNFAQLAPIVQANATFQGRPWGDSGYVVRYSSTGARKPDAVNGSALTRANPVNSMSKTVGTAINNCIDPYTNGSTGKGTLIAD